MAEGEVYFSGSRMFADSEQIVRSLIREDANGRPYLYKSVSEPYTRLVFDTDVEVLALVSDASNVADWNTLFQLPTNGVEYTSVSVEDDNKTIVLKGGSSIDVYYGLFQNNTNLLSFVDTGCIVSILEDAFKNCTKLHTARFSSVTITETSVFSGCIKLANVYFPELITVGTGTLANCDELVIVRLPKAQSVGTSFVSLCNHLREVYLPLCESVGSFAFDGATALELVYIPSCVNLGSTTGNDSVFVSSVTEREIELTIPSALMTNNAGNPDGDIQYLIDNDTATIIQT